MSKDLKLQKITQHYLKMFENHSGGGGKRAKMCDFLYTVEPTYNEIAWK